MKDIYYIMYVGDTLFIATPYVIVLHHNS